MKNILYLRPLALLLCAICCLSAIAAKKKTIVVEPDNAAIFVNGSEVGTGTYTLTFDRKTDFYMLRFEAPGYLDRTVKLHKDNPNNTISYKLSKDEAMLNSIGGESESGDLANRWFDVTCREDLTEDVIWKRLMSIAVNNFENIEVRDREAGWIKTGWVVTRFPSQTVRTRLEVRMSFSGEGKISYRVRLDSQIKDAACSGNSCYMKYDRLLTKYASVVGELTTTVGSNL